MKRLLSLALCALISACNQREIDPNAGCKYDQDVRREIFMECLHVVPQGPVATKYNDWSEVVDECGEQAKYMSLRGCSDTRARENARERAEVKS